MPPALVPPAHWRDLWAAIVEEDDFPVDDIDDTAAQVRVLIERIDASSRYVRDLRLSQYPRWVCIRSSRR